MLAAPDARPISQATLKDIVSDYLAGHEPFPDGMNVEVARQDGSGCGPASSSGDQARTNGPSIRRRHAGLAPITASCVHADNGRFLCVGVTS